MYNHSQSSYIILVCSIKYVSLFRNLHLQLGSCAFSFSLLSREQRSEDSSSINMSFLRNWDSSCPHVWSSWQDDAVNWVIRDLPPEDDENALKILLEELCRDETLLKLNIILNDPVSLKSIEECWRQCLKQRMSLGCYEEKDGERTLVALDISIVSCNGGKFHLDVEGKAWKNVYDAMEVTEKRIDCYKLLDVNMYLQGLGLIVRKEYRGKNLGSKILAAREGLCFHHCIFATATVITDIASQKSAERVGFTTAITLTLKQLAEIGLEYPKDDSKCIKVMVKKLQCKITTCDCS